MPICRILSRTKELFLTGEHQTLVQAFRGSCPSSSDKLQNFPPTSTLWNLENWTTSTYTISSAWKVLSRMAKSGSVSLARLSMVECLNYLPHQHLPPCSKFSLERSCPGWPCQGQWAWLDGVLLILCVNHHLLLFDGSSQPIDLPCGQQGRLPPPAPCWRQPFLLQTQNSSGFVSAWQEVWNSCLGGSSSVAALKACFQVSLDIKKIYNPFSIPRYST